MSNENVFVVDGSMLLKYTGQGGDLVIPDGIKSINTYGTFPDDMKFSTVTLPDSFGGDFLSVMGLNNALADKTAAYIVDPEHPSLACIDGVLYNKERTILVSCPGQKEGELILPKTVQKIEIGALDKACGITALRVDSDNGTICDHGGLLYSKDKKELLACPSGMSGTATLAAETESINFGALEGCPHVTAYIVPPENAHFASIDGVLYNKTADCLVKYPEGRDGEFVVPDCVHSCDEYAFQRAHKLTKITIPASVQKLSGDAFRAAVNLKELIMPSAIYDRQARNGALLEWVELTGAGRHFSQDGVIFFRWNNGTVELDTCPRGRSTPYTVPDGIAEIAERAFQGCKKLPEIYFAGKIPKMAQYAFLDCTSLQIPKQYLRTADKVPVAFALKEKDFDQTDFQWIAIHQTAKLWKEAVERFIIPLNKADFFQGMLDIMAGLKKIPKATGMNVLEFVQTWNTELKGQQIRTLREILVSQKCSAAVEAMDADSRLQAALSGEESIQSKNYDDPIEQLIRDNWVSSKLVEKTQRLVTTGIAYQGSEKLCHPDVLTFILAAYAEQMDRAVNFYSEYKTSFVRAVKHPVADQAAAALDRDAFLEFLESLAKDDRNLTSGYLIALGRYATPAKITKLISQMRDWENWGYGPNGRKAIIIARGGLMLSDTREAMLAVDKVGGLDYYAGIRGTTAEDLRDTVLSDFGLDEDGKKVCDLGNGHSVEIRLNTDLSLEIYDLTTNRIVKSIPKKGADPECHVRVNAVFSDMKKNAKKIAKARNDRLFQAFLEAAEFPAASWKNAYLKNPLLRQVASLLVWEQEGVTFTILNRGVITHDENPMTLTNAPIRLAHPMEMDVDLVTSWQKYFNTKGLKQMFPQIWEPVFDPASVQKDRYDGCTVPVLTMSKQKKHGMGVDGLGAYSDGFELWLTDCAIQAEPSDWRYVPGVNDDFFYTLGDFTFKKYTRWTNHIVGWFDRYVIIDKIKKDDASVQSILSGFTLAQITEFINLASENNCTNVTAILLDYKNRNFADFDPMEEFALDL